ncbi:MAG TPA: hypothetical protein VFT13_11330 [Candidatus Krumholzibacteria bacterium]|nr:hypothetical protein [Candidatus Krumholzibacteria bacterium]
MATFPRGVAVRVWFALAPAIVAVPGSAWAEPHVRNGWYGGIGYGGCWANFDLIDTDESQWSGTLNLRAGYALDQDLLLGAEYMRWAKDYEIATLQGDVPVAVAFSGTVVAVTYFPGNAGFMLRAGLGVALADVDVDESPLGAVSVSDIAPDPGLAAMMATGYEVRLTTKFALGADFNVLYLGVKDESIDGAYVYGVNVQFNWYW